MGRSLYLRGSTLFQSKLDQGLFVNRYWLYVLEARCSKRYLSSGDAVSLFDRTVIPGEQNNVERDPESSELAENPIILDPGSHPARRDLAGMTNCDTVCADINSD